MRSTSLRPILTTDNFECFNNVRAGLVLIDRDCRILEINAAALEMLSCKLPLSADETCYNLFFQSSTPCQDCPCLSSRVSILEDRPIKKKKENEDIFIKERFSLYGEYFLLTLHDLTKEISLLRESDLTRKELNAKNIILKQKHRESEKQLDYLTKVFNHLPDLLAGVDSSFRITRCNSTVMELHDNERPQMCFEIMGRKDKCNQCPLEAGWIGPAAGIKKSHRIDDKFYTEEFNLFSPGKGGVLIFRDTTRQIQLIEQIRDQSEILTQKNKLLSGLTNLEIKMHKEADPKAVLEYFLDVFLPLYHSNAAAIVISDIRFASVWFTVQKGLNEGEMKALSKSFISREAQTSRSHEIPKEFLPWENTFQFSLIGLDERLIGIVLIKGFGSKDSGELTNIFKEPMGAFVQNRLLMRQLEEKVNTDPLTGLYNRGYIDKAIAEEETKLNKYNIHFAVVTADVNGLKKANDIYGHAIGDQLLLTVSKKLKSSVRVADIVARTGGDEFIILLTGTSDAGAQKFIERLDNVYFNNFFLETGNTAKFQVTVSLGAAGTDKFSPQDLIRESDRLMYIAKNAYYSRNDRYR
jgi:diguanylate cyclase (GGDEF)-like protein